MFQRLLKLTNQFPIFVVGGAVRDALLGRASHDYDLLLPAGNFLACLEQITLALGKKPFVLHHESRIWRYHIENAVIDVAPLGESLGVDLSRRDYTINSMAMSLADFISQDFDSLIDLHLGREHLLQQALVLTSPEALEKDSLRILRAARLIAELDYTPSKELEAKTALVVANLRRVPGERIWAELQRLTVAPFAARAYTWLEQMGVLAVLFPELAAERGLVQNQYHSYCVYEHSWKAFMNYLQIWTSNEFLESTVRARTIKELGLLPGNIEAICKLGALLHDIGKPRSCRYRDDGKVTFYRHEQIGAEMIKDIAGRLRLTTVEARLLTRFVRWHTFLAQMARQHHPHDGHLYRIAWRLGEYSVPLGIFSVADLLAKGEDMTKEESYGEVVATLNRFLYAFYFRYDEVVRPVLPLSPSELAVALNVPPGRWLHEMMPFVGEQAARGRVKGKAEMISLAKQYYDKLAK